MSAANSSTSSTGALPLPELPSGFEWRLPAPAPGQQLPPTQMCARIFDEINDRLLPANIGCGGGSPIISAEALRVLSRMSELRAKEKAKSPSCANSWAFDIEERPGACPGRRTLHTVRVWCASHDFRVAAFSHIEEEQERLNNVFGDVEEMARRVNPNGDPRGWMVHPRWTRDRKAVDYSFVRRGMLDSAPSIRVFNVNEALRIEEERRLFARAGDVEKCLRRCLKEKCSPSAEDVEQETCAGPEQVENVTPTLVHASASSAKSSPLPEPEETKLFAEGASASTASSSTPQAAASEELFSLDELLAQLKPSKKCCTFCHKRPDPDADPASSTRTPHDGICGDCLRNEHGKGRRKLKAKVPEPWRKLCTRCGALKPEAAYRTKTKKDWDICDQCRDQADAKASLRLDPCAMCGKKKPWKDFRSNAGNYYPACVQCDPDRSYGQAPSRAVLEVREAREAAAEEERLLLEKAEQEKANLSRAIFISPGVTLSIAPEDVKEDGKAFDPGLWEQTAGIRTLLAKQQQAGEDIGTRDIPFTQTVEASWRDAVMDFGAGHDRVAREPEVFRCWATSSSTKEAETGTAQAADTPPTFVLYRAVLKLEDASRRASSCDGAEDKVEPGEINLAAQAYGATAREAVLLAKCRLLAGEADWKQFTSLREDELLQLFRHTAWVAVELELPGRAQLHDENFSPDPVLSKLPAIFWGDYLRSVLHSATTKDRYVRLLASIVAQQKKWQRRIPMHAYCKYLLRVALFSISPASGAGALVLDHLKCADGLEEIEPLAMREWFGKARKGAPDAHHMRSQYEALCLEFASSLRDAVARPTYLADDAQETGGAEYRRTLDVLQGGGRFSKKDQSLESLAAELEAPSNYTPISSLPVTKMTGRVVLLTALSGSTRLRQRAKFFASITEAARCPQDSASSSSRKKWRLKFRPILQGEDFGPDFRREIEEGGLSLQCQLLSEGQGGEHKNSLEWSGTDNQLSSTLDLYAQQTSELHQPGAPPSPEQEDSGHRTVTADGENQLAACSGADNSDQPQPPYFLSQLITGARWPRERRGDGAPPSAAIATRVPHYAKLEEKQRAAIDNAHTNEVSVIHGPPGTGKTTTLLSILRLWRAQGLRALVVAHANKAVDEVSSRLVRERVPHFRYTGKRDGPATVYAIVSQREAIEDAWNGQAGKTFRLQHPDADIPEKLEHLDHLLHDARVRKSEDAQNSLEAEGKLQGGQGSHLREVVDFLVAIRAPFLCTLARSGMELAELLAPGENFDAAVVDEAATASEPSAYAMLYHNKSLRRLVLCGDHRQNAPVVRCEEAKHVLGVSLFERLLLQQKTGRIPVVQLDCQHRSHPSLAKFSKRWYAESIRDGQHRFPIDASLPWPRYKDLCRTEDGGGLPALATTSIGHDPMDAHRVLVAKFRRDDYPESKEQGGRSWQNIFLASRIVEIVAAFVVRQQEQASWKRLPQGLPTVGVITFYKAQARNIEREIRAHAEKLCHCVEVGTVDAFQGKEKDLIFLDTTRTGELGFMQDTRKMNVALTRAKWGLVVFFCPDLVYRPAQSKQLEHGGGPKAEAEWKNWLDWQAANNAVVDVEELSAHLGHSSYTPPRGVAQILENFSPHYGFVKKKLQRQKEMTKEGFGKQHQEENAARRPGDRLGVSLLSKPLEKNGVKMDFLDAVQLVESVRAKNESGIEESVAWRGLFSRDSGRSSPTEHLFSKTEIVTPADIRKLDANVRKIEAKMQIDPD
eukprot:g8694.t1